ncbi:MAG: tetratricopeptide repeat protein [Nitrospira sp.]|nr:tetratricopeptide repeat protein [Nitrospira sp.]
MHESVPMRPGLNVFLLTVSALLFSWSPTHAHSTGEHASLLHGDPSESFEPSSEFGFNERADTVTELGILRRAVRLLPNVPEYRLKLADALLRVGDLDAAIEECRAAIRLQQDDGRAYLQLGLLFSAKQDWRAAVSALTEAIRLEPNLPHAHYSLGHVHYSLGDVTAAVQSYRQALELYPHFPDAHYRLALLLRVIGQTQEAARHMGAAAIDGVPQARFFLGNAYKDGQGVEKNLGLAIFWWMQAIELGQQTAYDSLSKLRRQTLAPGLTTQRRMELLKGLQSYRTILWNDYPDMSRVSDRQSLGKVLLGQGRGEEAFWVLIKECAALGEEAHTELASLYEAGFAPSLKPFDKRILACFESTAADGFVPAKKFLAPIYAKGLGLDPDTPKAKALLKDLPKRETKSLLNELGLR